MENARVALGRAAMKTPPLSILISTHNRSLLLRRCLESVFFQDIDRTVSEVLVFDDQSTDDTRAAASNIFESEARRGWKKLALLPKEPRNVQIAAARRKLTEAASLESAYLLFVDDDAALAPGALAALLDHMENNPRTGAAGPRFARIEDPRRTLHGAHFVNSWTGRYTDADAGEELPCDWLNSSALLARRAAVEKIDGFWPGFHTAHEDVDFCLQVKEAGFDVVYVPQALAFHDADTNRPKRERLFYLYRNKGLLFHRRFSGLRKFTSFLVYAGLGLPRAVVESLVHHKGVAADELKGTVEAAWDGLLNRSGPKEGRHG
jgi:GT2 family glycosyltransferase